jgi:hypothetical protein
MVSEEDQVAALRWLANLDGLPGAALWDSDVMIGLGWTAQQTQEALRSLEEDGCITCREVHLAGEGVSLGFLAVTRTGRLRLRSPQQYERRSVILRRLRHPLTL